MKKLQNILLVLFVLFISNILLASNLYFGPYLQSPKTDGITVLWRTTEPVIGNIIYGLSPEKLDKNISESEQVELHKFKITGLKPNQKYYYKCIWENGSTEVFHFKTAPNSNETPFRIAVIADSRTYPEIFSKVVQKAIKYESDIFIHSGDFVSKGTEIEQWKPQFFDPAKELLATNPLYPSLGNHEKKTSYYFEHFTIHEGKPWWSADYGSVHIISLSTEDDGSPNSEQYKWLVEDLRANKDKKWKIVIFHVPLFHVHESRPVYDIRYYWTPLFIENNVNLTITGHDHYYNRTFPIGNMSEKQQGTIHITSAGGGADLYSVTPRNYSAYSRSIYHFIILDVTENQINGKTISIDGDVFDTFSINKNQDYMPNMFIEYEMFELENRVKYAIGEIEPFISKDDAISFDANAVINTNFKKPVKGFYKWDISDNWELTSPVNGEFILNPGDSLIIPLKVKTQSAEMLNAPVLNLHIEGDNSVRNVLKTRPYEHYIGFKNQEIKLSLEEAIFSKIKTAKADDVSIILNYIKYFHESEKVSEAIDYLGIAFSKYGEEINTSILDDFLAENGSSENRYWCYPLYFAAGNYDYFDEWMKLADKYAPYKIDLSRDLFSYIASREEMNTLVVKDWYFLGPFPNDKNEGLNIQYEPENRIELSASYKGINDDLLKWERREANKMGYVNLLDYFPENKSLITYAYSTFETKEEGKLLILLGSDDGAAVWLNGKEYFRLNKGRSAYACDDIIPVPVKKGKNEILLKISQSGGDWEYFMQIMDKEGIIKQ